MAEESENKDEQIVHDKQGGMLGLSILGKIVGLSVAVWLVSLSYYAFLFFCLGMLPAILTAFIDRRSGKYATKTVAACNFVGIIPYLFEIMMSYDHSYFSRKLLENFEVLVPIYLAGISGWMTIWVVPQITRLFYGIRAEMRIGNLRQEQEEILKEWGDSVKK